MYNMEKREDRREISNEQRLKGGKNKDTKRTKKKDKDEIRHVLQPDRSPRILTRKNKMNRKTKRY